MSAPPSFRLILRLENAVIPQKLNNFITALCECDAERSLMGLIRRFSKVACTRLQQQSDGFAGAIILYG